MHQRKLLRGEVDDVARLFWTGGAARVFTTRVAGAGGIVADERAGRARGGGERAARHVGDSALSAWRADAVGDV